MFIGKKADIGIIALSILIIIAAAILIVPATGEDVITGDVVAEGFSAEGEIGIMNTHTSNASLEPEWSVAGVTNDYNVTITNTGGDSIDEIRIMQNPDYEDFDCDEKVNWTLIFVPNFPDPELGPIDMCWYFTDDAHAISDGDSEIFYFEATAPTEDPVECLLRWKFETRDVHDFWRTINDTTSIDSKPPITNKTLGEPKKVDGDLEWINGITPITLNATDMSEECRVGVKRIYYKNILAADILEKFKLNWDCGGGNCEEKPCRDVDLCESLDQYVSYDDNNWTVYNQPFSKHDEPESCHILYYYSEDNLGNKEEIKTNCFFVDKTAPIGTKTVGDPKIPQDIEELGDGKAGWSVEEVYSPTHSAKLYVLDGTKDWAGVDIEVDVALKDITELSFWEYIKSYNPNGWDVNIILGIDADGDGNFEADLDGWHIGPDAWTLKALNGDTFVEMDGALGGNPTTGVWTKTNALPVTQWWTPDKSGAGFAKSNTYPWTFYDKFGNLINIFIPDPTQTSLIPNTNVRVKLIKLEIGGSGSWKDEIAYVDDLSLNNQIIMSEPPIYWVRDHVTPITLSCEDQPPHPSEDEKVCYKVSFDDPQRPYLTGDYCDEFGGTLEGEWCCDDVSESSYIFNFTEDSLHDLEYFCRDAVNKTSKIDKEWFIVDSQPPIITKTMIGNDHLGDCPPDPEPSDDVCFVADYGRNGVRIDVKDNETYHAVGGVECSYELWWEGEIIKSGPFGENGIDIIFDRDSTHTLKIWCKDALGNSVYDEEEFLVDSTPPVTNKTYGEPYVEGPFPKYCGLYNGDNHDGQCSWAEWINSSTPITLNATDAKVGVDKIYWRNLLIKDPEAAYYICGHLPGESIQDYCNPEFYYPFVDPKTPWNEYTDKFYKEEESCHVIEYYSVDKLGNEEDLQWQCVFVDDTAPVVEKVVGDENVPCEREECDYYITQKTSITLSCWDIEPHPVDHVSLWYRYRFAEDCNNLEEADWTDWIDPNGHVVEKIIYFPEDSCHELEYYCEDGLGNAGQVYGEIDIVDTQAPNTTKIIDPEPYIDNRTGAEYIDTVNNISFEATDLEPHPIGVNKTWYMNILAEDAVRELGLQQVDPERPCWEPEFCDIVLNKIKNNLDHPYFDGKWQLYEGPFKKENESCHVLVYYSEDKLGNEEDMNVNCFFVDKQPPETIKWYGTPTYPENDGYPKWITSDTPIYLKATDPDPHPSGVAATYYRITLVEDKYCESQSLCQEMPSPQITADSFFDVFTKLSNITIPKESCHLIEYYSVDNVNKTEDVKRQCVFVDNTPPTPVKEVGEPKTEWDPTTNPLDPDATHFYPEIVKKCWSENLSERIECWKVTLDTPISMSCIDPTPHPVDNERICFNVELDGDDYTDNEEYSYCDEYGGEMNDGYCCLDNAITNFTFLESSEHNLKFYCEDALGNKGELDEEKFKVEGNDFEIQLNKKWNLISVPVVLLNNDPEEVFKNVDVENCIQSVWTYDGKTDNWTVWTPGDAPDSLKVKPGFGYWIIANEDCMLTIGGSLLSPGRTPPSRKLVPGWNLIGYYGMDDPENGFIEGYYGPDENGADAYCALYSLTSGELGMPKWSSLYGYWETDEPQFEDYSMFGPLDPGAGYWINMKDNQQEYIYSPSTICYDWWEGWF